MGRDLKFRAWDTKNDKWAFTKFWLLGEVSLFDLLAQYRLEEHCNLEVMQFTGLSDKNGVEIYESDRIFHHKYQKEFVVIWNQDGCGWSLGDMALSKLCVPNLEVIGNIYESPELIRPVAQEQTK